MGDLLLAFAALGGRPIETLTPAEARLQPTMADAVDTMSRRSTRWSAIAWRRSSKCDGPMKGRTAWRRSELPI